MWVVNNSRKASLDLPPAHITRSRSRRGTSRMSSRNDEAENLLTPSEVAALFRVDPKTVTRWAKAGKIGSIRTLGGHRRFRESEVRGLLESVQDR